MSLLCLTLLVGMDAKLMSTVDEERSRIERKCAQDDVDVLISLESFTPMQSVCWVGKQ